MKIDHIAVYVQDLEGARDFFCRYFGGMSNRLYHNKTTDFRSYFLSFSDGSRLELMHRPELCADSPQLHIGFHHLSFSLGSKEAVDSLTAQLAADGFPTLSGPRTTGDGYYESCVHAVEGLTVELTV